MKIGILEPSFFSQSVLADLKAIGTVELYQDSQDLEQFIGDKDVLFIRLKYQINKKLIAAAKMLKFICTPTTGLNHIDETALNTRNIKIISLQNDSEFLQNIRATPEHTLGLLIALLRNYRVAFESTTIQNWDRNSCFGYEIKNSKIGIIGYGRVGSLVSKYLNALDANVSYFDIAKKKSPPNITIHKSIDELIIDNEIIILCASYNESNKYMIGNSQLMLMKDKFFINTARGELVCSKSLIELLNLNHFKGVAIDVWENEQESNKDALVKNMKHKNFLVSPHIGGATYTSLNETERHIFNKFINTLDSKS